MGTQEKIDATGFVREVQIFDYLLAPATKRENNESRIMVRNRAVH